jgi:pyrroloquinoline-quinone synthase
MVSKDSHPPTEAAAIDWLTARPILRQRYFKDLADGRLPHQAFVDSQVQFSHAVGFFSRCLAALIARLPTSAARAVLVHNLAEEHGLDEEHPALGFRPPFAHDRTFAKFLLSLGHDATTVPRPPVQAFNLALLGACSAESPGFAFAALGIIEYAFADISAEIGRHVVQRGWVQAAELTHYSLHAEIDKRHAAELFEAAERAEDIDYANDSILAGLAFGHYIFARLYLDLCHEDD